MSNIPYDAQVVYLESTGTQYIDTGFKPNQDTRIVATMQCVTSTNYGRLFGCGKYSTLNSVMIDYETGITGTLHIKYGNNSSWTTISSVHGDYETHTYDFNKNNFYLDSELVSSNTYGAFQSTSNLGIFTYINGNNVGQSTEFFIGRLYSFQIYDNDVLIRDFIPVRVGQEGCLYDKVSGELFSNAGTGNFISGNDFLNINGFVSPFRRRLLSTYRAPLPNYLCFTALESGTFTYSIPEAMTTLNIDHVSFSTDGQSWTTLNNIDNEVASITTPTVNAGDKVYWKGSGQRLANSTTVYSNFSSTCKFDVSGNIASLLYEDTFKDFYSAPRYEYMFGLVFSGSKVVHAGELVLPVTRVYYTYNLYGRLFQNCTELIECAPIIFADVLACWQNTYSGCTKLENPPIFPEDLTFNANSVFGSMFEGCTSLKKTPKLPYSLTNGCYSGMFRNCTSLTEVDGGLPATTLVPNCYRNMFDGCTSLTTAPELNAKQTTSYSSAYQEMFVNTKVNYLKCMSISVIDATRWLNGVPNVSTSIFVKHINATWTNTGTSGVPTNWTVIYYDPALDKYYLDQQRQTECDDHGNPI